MAVGTIAIFSRMAPAIAVIIERNERSLKSCEDMLALMAITGSGSPFSPEQARLFQAAYDRAVANVTEPQEPDILKRMEPILPTLFQGAHTVRKEVVEAVVLLGKINRDAMILADHRAQQLGRAGAWGVVLMALSVFLAGVIFIRNLTGRVVKPLEEIHAVIIAHRNGDTMRRCTGTELAQDVVAVFTGINELFDQCQALAARGGRVAEPEPGQENSSYR
jgi:hypothetical protein